MPRRNRAAGFTIIEMIVTVAIFAILVAVGIPAMRTWVANTKVRSVAEALQNGVRLAQAESLRRSRQTVFWLTTSTTPQTDATPTAATNGSYWAIDAIPAISGETLTFIQSGVLTSQGSNVQINGPAAICFNSTGRLVSNSSTGVSGGNCALTNSSLTTGTGSLTSGTGLAAAAAAYIYKISLTGADHPLWVEVAIGGQLRVCDPSQTLSNTNSYGC
jgi:type IV fimbrial biogenesis protein FimT